MKLRAFMGGMCAGGLFIAMGALSALLTGEIGILQGGTAACIPAPYLALFAGLWAVLGTTAVVVVWKITRKEQL